MGFILLDGPDLGPQPLVVLFALSQNPGLAPLDRYLAQQPLCPSDGRTGVQELATANEQRGAFRPVGPDNSADRLSIPKIQINRTHPQLEICGDLVHRFGRLLDLLFQRRVQTEPAPALNQDRAASCPLGGYRLRPFDQPQLDPLPALAAVQPDHDAAVGPLLEHPGIKRQIEIEQPRGYRRTVVKPLAFGLELLFLFLPALIGGIKRLESAPSRIDGRAAHHRRDIGLDRFIEGPERLGVFGGAVGKFFGLTEGFFLIQVEQQGVRLIQVKVKRNDPIVQRFGFGLPGFKARPGDNTIALGSGCLGHAGHPLNEGGHLKQDPFDNRTCVLTRLESTRAKAPKRKPAFPLPLKGCGLRRAELGQSKLANLFAVDIWDTHEL